MKYSGILLTRMLPEGNMEPVPIGKSSKLDRNGY